MSKAERDNLRIVAAAIRTKDDVVHSLPPPARHHDIIRALAAAGVDQNTHYPDPDQQGFLLNNGQFTWRRPARYVAEKAGQLLPGAREHRELFSEDVW